MRQTLTAAAPMSELALLPAPVGGTDGQTGEGQILLLILLLLLLSILLLVVLLLFIIDRY